MRTCPSPEVKIQRGPRVLRVLPVEVMNVSSKEAERERERSMLEALMSSRELLSGNLEISTVMVFVQALGFYPLSQSLANFQV